MFECHQRNPYFKMLTESEKAGDYELALSIVGNYRIEKLIGKGTFSKVYLGQSVETGRLVALKVLQKQSLTFDAMSLFERELESLTRITRHANVLTILMRLKRMKCLL